MTPLRSTRHLRTGSDKIEGVWRQQPNFISSLPLSELSVIAKGWLERERERSRER